MTPATNMFGALALTVLTVFALWNSTLDMPAAAQTAAPVHASAVTAR